MTRSARCDAHAQSLDPCRCLAVLNERSRFGAASRGLVLEALRAKGADLVGGALLRPAELESAMRSFGPSAVDRILVGGGDGTLNVVLPALLRSPVPIGVLPLGTANDFAKTLGIPAEPVEAVRVALEGQVIRVDVGRVNDVPFLNVASLGLGSRVTETLSAQLKARLGFLGYLSAMLSAFSGARPFHAVIRCDDAPSWRMQCIHIAVGNGPRYGGGALIAEDARLDDGRLHLLALAPVPLWRLIVQAPWLGLGKYRDLAGAKTQTATRLRIETSHSLPISADGEIVTRTPAAFDLMPKALPVMVPGNIRSTTNLGPDTEPTDSVHQRQQPNRFDGRFRFRPSLHRYTVIGSLCCSVFSSASPIA